MAPEGFNMLAVAEEIGIVNWQGATKAHSGTIRYTCPILSPSGLMNKLQQHGMITDVNDRRTASLCDLMKKSRQDKSCLTISEHRDVIKQIGF